MIPLSLYMYNGLASPADEACRMDCEIFEVIRYGGSTGLTSIRIFLSYPAPLSRVHRNPLSIRAKQRMLILAMDTGTYVAKAY